MNFILSIIPAHTTLSFLMANTNKRVSIYPLIQNCHKLRYSNTCILLLKDLVFDFVALCVWSLHDYTNKKTFDDGNTAKEIKRKSLVPFSDNISLSSLCFYFKWKIAFSLYIILACLLIRLYGHSLVNGSIWILQCSFVLSQSGSLCV